MPRKKSKLSQIIENPPVVTSVGGPALFHGEAASETSRRNVAGSIERTDRFKNIDDGLTPFKNNTSYGNGDSSLDVRDAVVLCQKAYYNFSLFRNIIDLMTEFSISNIHFRGGNSKSRAFFEAWAKKINMWNFQDRFYREYYRSGTVCIYRFDTIIKPSDVTKIMQAFAAEGEVLPENTNSKNLIELPSRYIILNPADIQMVGSANLSQGVYRKVLNGYEIDRLKNPKTDEDREIFNSLDNESRKLLQSKTTTYVALPLPENKVTFVFYKKQDYEPYGVPMGYPVLEDLNYKAELKKMDMALTRTMQQMILLVTTGAEKEKGGVNPKNLEALKQLFANQSIGRVLVADYTTKASFVIPQIADILDPKKYEVIDRDINIGLNNIFASGEKFANQSTKTELFIARLTQGRQAFINDFLMPEIRRISKQLKFKAFPEPFFEDVALKDNTNYAKIYARLIELGLLTPEEGFEAIETNMLPEPDGLVESQKVYKGLRDKGLYQPLVGGAKPDETGRPAGSKTPKSTNTVSPIGTSKASVENNFEDKFSLTKIKDNLLLAQKLDTEVAESLKKQYKVKKFSKEQESIAQGVSSLIMMHETPSKWLEVVKTYVKNPVGNNGLRAGIIDSLAAKYGVDLYLASILEASRKE